MSDVRKPPTDARFAIHLPQRRGKCRWCGLATTERGRIYWHSACELEYHITIRPEIARDALFRRDQGVCVDCGEDWSDRYRFQKGSGGTIFSDGDGEAYRAGFYRYTEVIWVSLWHNDHKVPLWKARHLPALERLWYFTLANMVTRCESCHKFKTKQEAAERAKFNAQAERRAGKPDKPKKKWGSRKLQSGNRFPPKGSTPMRRR